ncbi:MAG: FMN-binding protein [Myxococcales bacterium]|nr:FMN-binding protein [Myxococcales bacterium]
MKYLSLLRVNLVTALFVAVSAVLSVVVPKVELERAVAQSTIGDGEVLSRAPTTIRSGESAALFFETARYQGLIRGVVIVDRDLITDVVIFQAREGHDGTAFVSNDFARSFQGLPATPPVSVDVVSGATVSSQAVNDAINERLTYWKRLQKK